MKKTSFYLAAFLLLTSAAQVNAQRIAIAGGLNLSNIAYESNFDAPDPNTRNNPGFHMGVVFNFPIVERVSVQTGVLVTTKGYRFKSEYNTNGTNFENEGSFTTFNIEIPVTAKVTWKLSKIDWYVLLGPTVGFGIFGVTNYDGRNETVNFGDDQSGLKRLDMGLKGGSGIRYNKFLAELSYTYGLSNISSYNTTRNRVFSVSVGYWFGSFE